ncbi:MAG: fibrobacter succinogenes major paralogous domain-containing protein [Bacteroidia bacterium]|nr:fibrobacter succinogenes major paralogous domain-containing protein [Bacteroidia bacterium]
MKNLINSFSVGTIMMVLLLTSCEKPTLPTVSSTVVSNITGNTASSGGNVTSDGGASVISRGVCWNTSENPIIANSKTTDGTGTGEFTSNITGLTEGIAYHVRAYATNSEGTAYGEDLSFSTIAKSTITTTAVSNITATTATCGGNVTSDGGNTVIERGVCWSTSVNPTISDSKTTDGTGIGSFVSSLSGLAGNTTYYVRAYATNSVGTGYGDQISFTTLPPVPTLTTTAISSIMSHSCLSGGNIISDEGYPVTEYGVCWSTSPHPTIADRRTFNGSGTGTFSSTLKSLSQNTTYYARAFAINYYGVGYGNEVSFTTITSPTIYNTNLTYGTLTDIDGNVYKTITIGSQVWMAENLRTTKYQNGDLIGTTTLPNSNISGESSPKYQWVFDANESNLLTYGRLYTWYVATDSRNLCPSGWHVPSDAEWTTLTTYLGGYSIAGSKLKEIGTTHWFSPNTGATNETGFTALPGGHRLCDGTFLAIGDSGLWWWATERDAADAWFRLMNYDISSEYSVYSSKKDGFSIRCLRD